MIEELRLKLATEQARYDALISQGAGRSLKDGELDVWALARHAHVACAQIRAQLKALGETA